jgi:hypothetical protein
VIKNFLNPEGHHNPISGSEVMAILLKEWILPIGGASAGEGLCLQQMCAIYIAMQRYRPISVILSDIVTVRIRHGLTILGFKIN